jgi:L-ascorbate metabolism protein UlaG (beta-lactamase superfamily)
MLRFLPALTAAALWAAGAAADDGKSAPVTIRWQGQSFFEIQSSKGTRVAIDPHFIDAYGRKDVSADLILVTHEHDDHNQVEAVKNYAKARIIHGLREVNKRLDWNPVDENFRDIHVRTVGVYHDHAQGMEKGKNAVFVLEVDGLHIVHLGDLGHLLTPQQLKKIGPVDVLMIPVGGVYALNGSEAKKVVEQIKPRQYILPMHYGTKVFDDLLPVDEFLEDQPQVKRLPGNKLTTDASFKPAEPVIVVMDWKNN